jgi:hypothetical protein
MKVTGWCVQYEPGLAAPTVIATSEDTQPRSRQLLGEAFDAGPYWDRPREHWPHLPDGGLIMFSRSLDLDSLLAEAK